MSHIDCTLERPSGSGTLCAEAQADGVPCGEAGRPSEQCERAVAERPREEGFVRPGFERKVGASDA